MRAPVLLLSLILASCAGRPDTVALAPPFPSAPPPTVAPAAPTPINAGLSPAATLWHLRAGLNVAALACRGADEAVIAARYNALLADHSAPLAAAAAAYADEYRAANGSDWRDRYDDAMTRLYNFWAQARGRAAFCAAAGETLAALATTPDAALAAVAAARLARLDRPFAPPRIEVDARVFGGPAMVMVASR